MQFGKVSRNYFRGEEIHDQFSQSSGNKVGIVDKNNIIPNTLLQSDILLNHIKQFGLVLDKDKDGYGDTPHKVYQYADKLWMYNPDVKFFYGSPVISLLNFLAKLAPFSEPIFLMEDLKPIIKVKS